MGIDSTTEQNLADRPARGIVAGMRHDHTATEPTRRQKRDPLAGLMPRGLNRVAAAIYVGVSPSVFDRMIRDGLMPRPVRIYNRTVWDRRKLDDAFAVLSDDGPAPDPWDRVQV